MGAKLAIQAGMDAIWSSGFEISTAHAVPDASILTMSEYLAAAHSIADAVAPVPVIADCDTGYGNSNNVIRMVHQFEAAGVAAVCIEDKKYPKTNSFIPGKQELASIAEFVGKLLAAKNAQRTSAFAVIARTEALIAGWGVDEAIRRCEEYVRAGADALLVHDKSKTAEGIRAFLAKWRPPVPVIVVPTSYPTLTVNDAKSLGIKTVIYANQGIRASARALTNVWQTIARDGNSLAVEGSIATMGELFEVQGMPEHKEAERAFDRGGPPPTRAVILHAGEHRDDPSLAPLTADVPLAALDLNGMTLVERQVTMLHQCGVNDITVVAGYRHEAVSANGAGRVVNDAWKSNGEVGSLLAGAASLNGGPEGSRVLVCYGDVIVERTLLERLLASDAECMVLVDRSGASGRHVRDRVTVDGDSEPGRRFLSPSSPRRIMAIGAGVDAAHGNGEFAGLLLVSGQRWSALRSRAEKRGSGALPDLLADAMRDGDVVTCLEVTSGWLEVRTFADYEMACRMVTS